MLTKIIYHKFTHMLTVDLERKVITFGKEENLHEISFNILNDCFASYLFDTKFRFSWQIYLFTEPCI